ncbi:PTS system mannose/fructose/N-acetylgalactosamine-transporter subunit IIB [Liquorilactobacillus mali]|uniref:Phosphotransferase system, mannose fructose N-acetylgalactosamine-specific component IIB n=1 Tax=Liquorilactobacillus mali KCTC 3596 = DSM 20444 TaxID=1046596 RepID=A0A0R2EA79_9LACO|nr:PTS sugar transporter subunit IIB [Liquorilactobacillus mali]KRN09514.1 phosphotransferase system, mannose fructose N-acetylgalactosamine-specific component IIB [Liquorilactobacillus mali KCTC 3596 = DSM 20444]QFQ73651.1 PTS sugar transporter subunit IIB [Liquorilactobacillus mali]
MAITAVRIDGRLLHGQVANMWTNVVGATRIMVIDDEVASSDVAKAGIKLAKPTGVNLSILSEQKAVNNINEGRYDSQKVFILVRHPRVLVNMIQKGVPITSVNVGNMSQTDETKAITNSINVVQADVDAFNELHKLGVSVTAQMVPSDPVLNFIDLLKKF